jgi:hypothetical protein
MANLTYPDVVADATNGTTGTQIADAFNEIKTVVNENAGSSGGDLYQQLMNDKDVVDFWLPSASPRLLQKSKVESSESPSPYPLTTFSTSGVLLNSDRITFPNQNHKRAITVDGAGAMTNLVFFNMKAPASGATFNTFEEINNGNRGGSGGLTMYFTNRFETGYASQSLTQMTATWIDSGGDVGVGLHYAQSDIVFTPTEAVVTLYIDGIQRAQKAYTGAPSLTESFSAQRIDSNVKADTAFWGRWNRQLTQQEALDIYNKLRTEGGLPEV